MRFPNIGLLLIATLGVTQPSWFLFPDSVAIECRDATITIPEHQQCLQVSVERCEKMHNMQQDNADQRTKACANSVQKGQKGCKRGLMEDARRRGPSVPMDVTGGTPWAAEDQFGTTGLGSCSFVVIYDDAYILGAHIPPARAVMNGNQLDLAATRKKVINDHIQHIDRYLPNVKKTKNCILLTATNLGQEELTHMRQKLAAKGLRCTEKKYDPTKVPHKVACSS